MNLLSVENLSKNYAEKVIFSSQTFGIDYKERIGLIGINGCGKSTLLKVIAGLEYPDSGSIVTRNNLKVGYLSQEPYLDPDLTIYEQIYHSNDKKFRLLREFHDINFTLEKKINDSLLKKQQELTNKIEQLDAWKIEVKAKSLLTKFGLYDFSVKTGILSGGQKRRLDLIRTLLDDPELLLLDEPTNHLDVDIIEWLQDLFIDYKGSIVFVTHDRYFLDAVSTKIFEIDKGSIKVYKGNYSLYLHSKQLELQDLESKENRRISQLKKELKWLQRGAKARTSKPKSHVDRVQELLDKSYLVNDRELNISFKTFRLGKKILEVHNVSKSFDKPLFQDFSHIFQKNERIGIIGSNASGKTTLLKIITEKLKPDKGSVKVGLNTKLCYFEQEIDEFDKNCSVLEYIREVADNIRTRDGKLHSASQMLETFLFDKKMQQSRIFSLSGGEKKRLYLLKSLMLGTNFIILDEPTNDLDIKTLEILEDYLDAFQGCILVVSHDRFFLDRVVDFLFIFENEKIAKFPGNYSDYLIVKKFREDKETLPKNDKEKTGYQYQKHRKRKLSFNESRELEALELHIEQLEKKINELNEKINFEAKDLTAHDFTVITQKLDNLEIQLEKSLERWEELQSIN